MGRRHLLAIPLALLASGSAHAQDACLGGTSTLVDQRGLATWRATLETTCPCASASSRASFRRCAKGVVGTALGDGTLRAECEKTAKRTVKTASCGTRRLT